MRIYDGRPFFYQWDTNQKITSDQFKVGDEIHFFNIKQWNALVVIAYELNNKIVVDVPNILLQKSYPIIAYRVFVDDDGKATIEEHQFKVKQRPKPEDYVYTETEVKSWENLDERLKNAVYYTPEERTEEEKAQARANIGAGTTYTLPQASSDKIGGVKADFAEATDTQPVRIGDDNKLYTSPGGKSVLYTEQSLTDAQKEQARTNIGAEKVLTSETWTFTLEDGTTVTKEVYVK